MRANDAGPLAAIDAFEPRSRRARRASVSLDRIDVELLGLLQQNGRISKSELATKIGLSNSSCLERMRKLEANGIIESYHAKLNYSLMGNLSTFFTTIMLRTHRQNDFGIFEQYVKKISMISECYALGGGIDYIVKSSATSVGAYQEMIDNLLDANVGVDRYFTYIVTKDVKFSEQVPIHNLIS